MFCVSIIIPLFLYISGALTVKLGPCKKGDNECLTKVLNDIHPIVLSGIPSLEVEPSDPMFHDLIEGNFPNFKYKYTDSTVRGFKDCVLKNVIYSPEVLKIHYEMDCPKLSISGHYEISGKLLSLPIEGKGTFEIVTGKYFIHVDEDLKEYKDDDDKTHTMTSDFTLDIEAIEPIHFEFKGLFDGQKDLSDAAHHFAHENWKKVSEVVQEPIFRKNIETIYENYNKFLNTIAMEEIFEN